MQATAVPELDEELRKQCLHLLYKMCKDCKMLPASYGLQQGSLSVDDICYSGGFADVSAGRYLRRRVAVKRLRFWTKNGPDGFFKVFKFLHIWYFTVIHFEISGFVGRSSSGSASLIPTSCHCWEFHSPWIHTPSAWSPPGCEMGT